MARRGTAQITAERRLRAWELRKQGYTLPEISRELGIADSSTYALIKKTQQELIDRTNETAEAWRALELERLEAVIKMLQPNLNKLAVVDRYLRAIDLQARIAGVYQPVAIANTGEGQQIIQIISNPEVQIETSASTQATDIEN